MGRRAAERGCRREGRRVEFGAIGRVECAVSGKDPEGLCRPRLFAFSNL